MGAIFRGFSSKGNEVKLEVATNPWSSIQSSQELKRSCKNTYHPGNQVMNSLGKKVLFFAFLFKGAHVNVNNSYIHSVEQGCQTHFHLGPHQPCGCLQRAEIILGLYKCNYSLTVKESKLHSALCRQLQGLIWPPVKMTLTSLP